MSPYAGIRYTQNNMGGYTEGASASVTSPLTYGAVNANATTALAGVGASYRFIPKATVYASAGVETDTNTANGTYAATGISGLTPINFNANPVKTRPTATLGAYYDVEKNQRVLVALHCVLICPTDSTSHSQAHSLWQYVNVNSYLCAHLPPQLNTSALFRSVLCYYQILAGLTYV